VRLKQGETETTCRKCGCTKPNKDFRIGRLVCKSCRDQRDKAVRNPQKRRISGRRASKRWAIRNPEKVKEMRSLWTETHREHLRERQQRWRKTRNRGQWYQKQLEYRQIWRKNNPDKARDRDRRARQRRRAILEERIRANLSSGVRRVLLNGSLQKSSRIFHLLRCDIDWLKAWLEIQFQPGMGWHNYGQGWHIDHIRPCISFDLTDPKQQQLCFHWTNLQPLWATDNLSKGAKWVGTEP
jgi:hypothetical protein